MKKNIVSFGVIVFALIFVLIACDTKKPAGLSSSITSSPKEQAKEPPAPIPAPTVPERSYILISQLAFKGYLARPDAKISETKALYSSAQNDTRELSSLSKNNEKDKDLNTDQKQVYLMRKVDLCPCSTGSGLCPCPGDTTATALAARTYNNVKVNIDGIPLESSANIEGDQSWTLVKWPRTWKDGEYKMVITGMFTEKAINLKRPETYTVPVAVQGGKFYLNWK